MWFESHIKAYKVNVKFIKILSHNIFTIGFPQHVLNIGSLLQFNFEQEQDTKAYLCYKTNHSINKKEYVNWCNTMLAPQTKQQQSKVTTQGIVQQLKHFDTANSSPMQALELVVKLKALL